MAASDEKGARPRPLDADQTDASRWEYIGVGCFSAFVGIAGGGMIAVMIAKIIGVFSRCTPDKETGAPCSWFTYAFFGAVCGFVLVPTISVWLFHRGRARANRDRG